MQVQDLCTTETRCCSPATSLAAAGCMMYEGDCGALPVVDEGGRLVGIITDRDICMAAATKHRLASEIEVREVINEMVTSCRMDEEVSEALEKMRARQVRRLPVIDAEGRLRGLLSLSDVVLAARPETTLKPGCVTYAEVIGTLDAVCRPRNSKVRKSAKASQRILRAAPQ